MSKKNQNDIFKTINIPEGTIYDSFQKYVENHNKKEDIIIFLSLQNARLLKEIGLHGNDNIPESYKKEIVDFYEYFIIHYYDRMKNEMMKMWNDGPLILRAGHYYMEEENIKNQKKLLASIPEEDQRMKDAKALSDRIMNIRKNKKLTASFITDPKAEVITIPATIKREALDEYKEFVLYLCLRIILDAGVMICRIFENNGIEKVFAIQADNENNTWKPVEVEMLKESFQEKGKKEEYIMIQQEPGTIISFNEKKKERGNSNGNV